MSQPDLFWTALSNIPSLERTKKAWEQHFDIHFPRVKAHLCPGRHFIRSYPCQQPCGNGCPMSVRETRDGFIAYCPDEHQQADSLNIAADDVLLHSLDIVSVMRVTAKALSIAANSIPVESTRHTWHMGTVSLGSGKTLPVYFVLPMGRSKIVDSVRSVLAPANAQAVFLIPDPSTLDANSQSLIDGNNSFVYSLNEIAKGLPGKPDGEIKPLASIIASATGTTEPAYQFEKKGEYWQLRWGNCDPIFLKDSRGLEYYACLLAHPRQPIFAFDLQNGFHPDADTHRINSGIEVTDTDLLQELRSEYDRLNNEISTAQRDNDIALTERLQGELSTLHEQAQKSFNKQGKSRKVNDPQEQARKNVTGAMAEARKRIVTSMPELGQHLTSYVTGGKILMYSPPAEIPWNI